MHKHFALLADRADSPQTERDPLHNHISSSPWCAFAFALRVHEAQLLTTIQSINQDRTRTRTVLAAWLTEIEMISHGNCDCGGCLLYTMVRPCCTIKANKVHTRTCSQLEIQHFKLCYMRRTRLLEFSFARVLHACLDFNYTIADIVDFQLAKCGVSCEKMVLANDDCPSVDAAQARHFSGIVCVGRIAHRFRSLHVIHMMLDVEHAVRCSSRRLVDDYSAQADDLAKKAMIYCVQVVPMLFGHSVCNVLLRPLALLRRCSILLIGYWRRTTPFKMCYNEVGVEFASNIA